MEDGSIIFGTKLDNKELDQELRKEKAKIIKHYDSIQSATAKKNVAVEQIKQMEAEVLKLQNMASFDGVRFHNTPENIARIGELQNKISALQPAVDRYEKQIEESNIDWELAKEKAGLLEMELAKSANEADRLDKNTKKSSKAMQEMEKRTRRFGSRMREIVTGALFFNIISRGISGMVNWMGTMISTNDEARASIASLKGALLTLAQPILNVVIPAFVSLVNILTRVIAAIASVNSRLFGTTAQKSAEAAEALNQQADAYGSAGAEAKEAAKSIMGFDELNTLKAESDSGGGGVGGTGAIAPNFDSTLDEEMQKKADTITGIVGAAVFAIGAILAFSGANIPLGIGMMVIGASMMYSAIALNWETMSESIRQAITNILVWLGTGLLVIGAIFAFSGANIGLGIGLMLLGAASLGAAAALNWDLISGNIKDVLVVIAAALGTAMLVLGALLTFSGVNPALGIGLMIAGGVAVLGAGGVSLDWNYIGNKLKEVWRNIVFWFNSNVAPKLTLQYWQDKFNKIGEAASNIWSNIKQSASEWWGGIVDTIIGKINSIISGINGLIAGAVSGVNDVSNALNAISFSVPDWVPGFGGMSFGFNLPTLNAPQIPYLAQGAVIPPNREFLAVLGDQSHGTNIEAPLETIKQAVAEVMGADMELMREQNDLLRQILERSGVYLDGREITNTVTKYQRQMARAKGG